mgnify:CR=1 FL=1|jgi:hypothetical protein|tara:strand:+ start:326 stop:730 length:405 start_codon:yes stop_codon:yes gene_type:complete
MNGLLHAVSLLVTAWLFGGMLLFAAGFAAFLFKALPQDEAKALIRKAVPAFYLFVIGTAGIAAALLAPMGSVGATVLTLIAASTITTRQVLMPAINLATNKGQHKQFLRLQGLPVVATLAHIAAAAVVLLRFAG